MINLRPTKEILFTTGFLLAVIFVSERISDKLQDFRNKKVYEFIAEANKGIMDGIESTIENDVSSVAESYRSEIESIYYEFIALKWFIILLFSYASSCVLFFRLESFRESA